MENWASKLQLLQHEIKENMNLCKLFIIPAVYYVFFLKQIVLFKLNWITTLRIPTQSSHGHEAAVWLYKSPVGKQMQHIQLVLRLRPALMYQWDCKWSNFINAEIQ